MSKNKKGSFGKKAVGYRGATAVKNNVIAGPDRKREPGLEADMLNFNHGTTMQELGRFTVNQTKHWEQDSRLRDQPVIFVSGGFIEPLEEPENRAHVQAPTKAELDSSTSSKTEVAIEPSPCSKDWEHEAQLKNDSEQVQDLTRTIPDSDPDSSEEIILFRGRGGLRKAELAEVAEASDNMTKIAVYSRAASSPQATLESNHHTLLDSGDDWSDAAINDYIANVFVDGMHNAGQLSGSDVEDLHGFQDKMAFDTFNLGDENKAGADLKATGISDSEGIAQYDGDDFKSPTRVTTGLGKLKTPRNANDEQLVMPPTKQEEPGVMSDDQMQSDSGMAQQSKVGKGKKLSLRKQNNILTDGLANTFRSLDYLHSSAGDVADAFEQLDLTGWQRNGNLPQLELSDSDLEATLKATWSKDRLRKKEKKQAREQLRTQGYLRKNADLNDPRIKYPNGMNINDMKTEFRVFLSNSEKSVTLPPMDAQARKVVHELSHRFNIASKSTGSGDQRRPILSRKATTVKFNEDVFESIFFRLQRRYFSRLDGDRGKRAGPNSSRRSGNPGEVTVRNGEVVGGSAPELSVRNKGRTILEKMGWSNGMALGAIDNQGITQPIEHIVKRSKAGLG